MVVTFAGLYPRYIDAVRSAIGCDITSLKIYCFSYGDIYCLAGDWVDDISVYTLGEYKSKHMNKKHHEIGRSVYKIYLREDGALVFMSGSETDIAIEVVPKNKRALAERFRVISSASPPSS